MPGYRKLCRYCRELDPLSLTAPRKSPVFAFDLFHPGEVNCPAETAHHPSVDVAVVFVSSLVYHVEIAIQHPWLCCRRRDRGQFRQKVGFLLVVRRAVDRSHPKRAACTNDLHPCSDGETSDDLIRDLDGLLVPENCRAPSRAHCRKHDAALQKISPTSRAMSRVHVSSLVS